MIDARIRKRFAGRGGSAPFELDVHLKTQAGVTALFGPSGAGKSLALDVIAGFVTPEEGRIRIGDVLLCDVAAGVHLAPRQRRCGYVFQNSALFPHMTLRENLAFGAAAQPGLERRRSVNQMLERFHLEELAGRKPAELSGGQQQRGSIARALLSRPRVLLLDEPSSGLDAPLRDELHAVIDEVRRDFEVPVLLVTHDLDEALALADEMFVLHHGRVIQQGVPAEILERPAREEVAALLGEYVVFEAEIVRLDPGAQRSRMAFLAGGEARFEFDGPYVQGLLLGARLKVGVRRSAVKVGPGGAALELLRTSRRAQTVRLEFEFGMAAEIPEAGHERLLRQGCGVTITPESVRVLR